MDERVPSMYYTIVTIPAVVIPLVGSLTFLMNGETSRRITILSSLFIFELLYIKFLDLKISNGGVHIVYLMLLYRNSLILITLAIILSAISDELNKCSIEEFHLNIPEWIKTVLKCILNKPRMAMIINFDPERAESSTKNKTEDNTSNSRRNKNTFFWKTLFILLDRLSFIITLILSLINFFLLLC